MPVAVRIAFGRFVEALKVLFDQDLDA